MILMQVLVLTILQPTLSELYIEKWTTKDKKIGIECGDCTKKLEITADNRKIAEKVLNETTFNSIFPADPKDKKQKKRHERYTYKKLMTAISMFREFCEDLVKCKRHMTFLLAHMQQEVGGLRIVKEDVKKTLPNSGYHGDILETYYFGRGAFQLTHDHNYKAFSKYVYKKECCLEKEPGKIISDDLEFVSAIWFFTNKYRGNMTYETDFGKTIKSINGNQECELNAEKKLPNAYGANCRLKYLKWFQDKLLETTDVRYEDIDTCLDEKEKEKATPCKWEVMSG